MFAKYSAFKVDKRNNNTTPSESQYVFKYTEFFIKNMIQNAFTYWNT